VYEANAHENDGYVHAEGTIYIIEISNKDERCPFARRWTLADGTDHCIIYSHENIHLKELEKEKANESGSN
jgi:hypothetical protein